MSQENEIKPNQQQGKKNISYKIGDHPKDRDASFLVQSSESNVLPNALQEINQMNSIAQTNIQDQTLISSADVSRQGLSDRDNFETNENFTKRQQQNSQLKICKDQEKDQSQKQESNQQESNENQASNGKKRWRKLSNILKGIKFFQQPQSRKVLEIDTFIDNLKQANNSSPIKQEQKTSLFENYDTIETFRRQELMFDLISRGSEKDIEYIEKILTTDPNRYKWTPRDPENLINKRSIMGFTPLYFASRHGHLSLVKFFLQKGANPHTNSILANQFEEGVLAVASRWGYVKLVDFLLENVEWNEKEIQESFSNSNNQTIRSMLKMKIKKKCFCRNLICFKFWC